MISIYRVAARLRRACCIGAGMLLGLLCVLTGGGVLEARSLCADTLRQEVERLAEWGRDVEASPPLLDATMRRLLDSDSVVCSKLRPGVDAVAAGLQSVVAAFGDVSEPARAICRRRAADLLCFRLATSISNGALAQAIRPEVEVLVPQIQTPALASLRGDRLELSDIVRDRDVAAVVDADRNGQPSPRDRRCVWHLEFRSIGPIDDALRSRLAAAGATVEPRSSAGASTEVVVWPSASALRTEGPVTLTPAVWRQPTTPASAGDLAPSPPTDLTTHPAWADVAELSPAAALAALPRGSSVRDWLRERLAWVMLAGLLPLAWLCFSLRTSVRRLGSYGDRLPSDVAIAFPARWLVGVGLLAACMATVLLLWASFLAASWLPGVVFASVALLMLVDLVFQRRKLAKTLSWKR